MLRSGREAAFAGAVCSRERESDVSGSEVTFYYKGGRRPGGRRSRGARTLAPQLAILAEGAVTTAAISGQFRADRSGPALRKY